MFAYFILCEVDTLSVFYRWRHSVIESTPLVICYRILIYITRTSLVDKLAKNLPSMQETLVGFLGRKYPLEKEITAHSNILAWKIPWWEKPGSLQSMGSQRVRHDWLSLSVLFTFSVLGRARIQGQVIWPQSPWSELVQYGVSYSNLTRLFFSMRKKLIWLAKWKMNK